VSDWYRSADVFVLPTLSDGFAITQIEAMSHGLPVIATPNCASVVENGVDGLWCPQKTAEHLHLLSETTWRPRTWLRVTEECS